MRISDWSSDVCSSDLHSDARQLSGPWAWLRQRVLSFGVVLALGFLLIVSMSLTPALQVVFALLPSLLPVVGDIASLALYPIAFAFPYPYLPDRPGPCRPPPPGGLRPPRLVLPG